MVVRQHHMGEFKGKVVSALNEGSAYVTKYLEQLRNNLGFEPFPGTLDLKIDAKSRSLLKNPLKIKGPTEDLAPVDTYFVMLNDEVEGAIVVPEKTAHDKTTIEIVSPVNLREHFGLKDGDEVLLRLE